MDVFYALAEPRRRKIVELLATNGQLSAGDICSRFDITAQAVSQHLRVLLDAGLVSMKKNAQRRIYRLEEGSMDELEEWTRKIEKRWNSRLDRLDAVLKREKALYAKRRYDGR